MANSSGNEAIFMLVAGLILVGIVIYISVIVLSIALGIGATFGGGVGFYNYGLSLKHNIKMEQPTP